MNAKNNKVKAVEAAIDPYSKVINDMWGRYPNGFRGAGLVIAADGLMRFELSEYGVPSQADADILRLGGFFESVGKAKFMTNRECTKPRHDYIEIKDCAEIFMDIADRWMPMLDVYHNNKKHLLVEFCRSIWHEDITSEDEDEDVDRDGDYAHGVSQCPERLIRCANRRAAAAEYVESMRWFSEHHPRAHEEYRDHIEGLVGGSEWRYPQVSDINDLQL